MLWEMLYPLDPFGFFVLFGCEGDCGIYFFKILVLVLAMQPTSNRREGPQPGCSGYVACCWHQIRDDRDWLGSSLRGVEGDAAMTGHVSYQCLSV